MVSKGEIAKCMQVCDHSIHTHECSHRRSALAGLDSRAQDRFCRRQSSADKPERKREKIRALTGCCNQEKQQNAPGAGSLRSALRFTGPRLICVNVNTKPFRNSQQQGPRITGARTCSTTDVWISVTCNDFTHAATSATVKWQLILRWYHQRRKL